MILHLRKASRADYLRLVEKDACSFMLAPKRALAEHQRLAGKEAKSAAWISARSDNQPLLEKGIALPFSVSAVARGLSPYPQSGVGFEVAPEARLSATRSIFTFVTGLMVDYGDIVPRRASARESGMRTIT